MLMDDTPEDRAAIQPVINQIVAYPLKDFDGKMKSKDWSKAPAIPGPILDLSFPRTFFDPREATLWHAASIGRIIGGYFLWLHDLSFPRR